MALLDDLPVGAVTGLDTAVFIYLIEGHATYGPVVLPFFRDRLEQGLNRGITSVITLAEVLTKPLKVGRPDLVQLYRDQLTLVSYLALLDVTPAVAERAADLRARFGLRLPDALQIAATLEGGGTLFLTNDIKLKKVTDLTVLVLDDYLAPPTP